MSEEEKANKDYNLKEMVNEFRIIREDIEKVKLAFEELAKSGTANERQDFDYFLKKIKFLLKDTQDTKRWFLHHKSKNWVA